MTGVRSALEMNVMIKAPLSPAQNFILLCDVDGDPQEVLNGNTTINYVFDLLSILDKKYPEYAPHAAWRKVSDGFVRLLERVEER